MAPTVRHTLHALFLICTIPSSSLAELNPVEIHSYKFFDSVSGAEFQVKGIDYYPRPNAGVLNRNSLDLFTDEYNDLWERDIPLLKELGVNAIRIYSVNASKSHDMFM